MTYTYDDAARALRMILRGLLMLILCIASAVLNVVETLVLFIIHRPLYTLMIITGFVIGWLFVPTLVALSWLIV